MSGAPIGVFDSGLGGFSVLRELAQYLPSERFCYVADSHYAPYGEKSPSLILQRSRVCCDWLILQGVKAIVVACNTATAAAVQQLRADYALPIIAMEPAVKPAARMTHSGRIGVLATSGTLSSEKYEALLHQHAAHVQVYSQPCPGLVEEIEKGDFTSAELLSLLKRYIQPLIAQQVDTLILGCTHYPLIREQIVSLVGTQMVVVDSGAAVARRVGQLLRDQQLLSHGDGAEPLHCWSSADPHKQQAIIRRLWDQPFTLQALPQF